MRFDKEGFLSAGITTWMTKARAEYVEWFQLADQLNQEGMKLLFSAQPSHGNNKEFVAALLFGRALQAFQGSVLLSERGMGAEARTLVRNCAEAAIALGNVALSETFLDELIADYDKHRLTIANVFLNDPDCMSELPAPQLDKLRGVADAINAQYHPNRPKDINWATAASEAGMTALYNTVYRGISGDAAHVTIDALTRHIKSDADNNVEHLTFRPSSDDLADTLSAGASAILHAMEALGRIFGQESVSNSVSRLGEVWRGLAIPA